MSADAGDFGYTLILGHPRAHRMRRWQSDQYATNMFGSSFSLHILYSVREASIGTLVTQNAQGLPCQDL